MKREKEQGKQKEGNKVKGTHKQVGKNEVLTQRA